MNLKDWAPLKFVNSELLSQIRLAYVFGMYLNVSNSLATLNIGSMIIESVKNRPSLLLDMDKKIRASDYCYQHPIIGNHGARISIRNSMIPVNYIHLLNDNL